MGKEIKIKEKRQGLKNRDLLIIAILSGIGGVMSTYVGYLGNLLNRIFGVPFGAGQFVSGLHVFWIILVAGLVRRPGAATAAGLLKGVIELLTGSTHGLVIVLISVFQGVLVDIVLLVFKRYTLTSFIVAGGIATASNVFVFQILYFSGAPLAYILFIALLALISGILLAGSFGHSVLEIILEARPFRMLGSSETIQKKSGKRWKMAITVLLIVALSAGALYYYGFVFQPPWVGPVVQVEGMVENPLSFQLSSFSSHEKTINTDMEGEVTYIPPQDYTGVPLNVILSKAHPRPEAETLVVTATDGYSVEFLLTDVLEDEDILLIMEDDYLRLIAPNYAGGHWVKMVSKLTVK